MAAPYVFKLEVTPIVWIITIAVVAVLLLVIFLITIPIALFSIKLYSDEMVIGAPLWPSITIRKGDVEYVAIVNLSREPELRPKVRLFGCGLPNYRLGWFKLLNGAKAYLAVGRWEGRAVLIKLKDGDYVILSPKNFSIFESKLKLLGWIK